MRGIGTLIGVIFVILGLLVLLGGVRGAGIVALLMGAAIVISAIRT
jgi:hypothetical protein